MTSRKIVPGPGKYEFSNEKVAKSTPKYGFGTGPREGSKKSGTPGPGNYEYTNEKVAKSTPKYGFGTGPRGVSKKPSTPGPGTYRIPCNVIDVPRYLQTIQPEEFRFI